MKQRSDKGKKRSKYEMKIRITRKQSNDLLRTIKDIAKFEKRQKKSDKTVAEKRTPKYRDGMTQQEYRKQKRDSLLPANRICPKCNEVKSKSKQWVIKPGLAVICKACSLIQSHEADN